MYATTSGRLVKKWNFKTMADKGMDKSDDEMEKICNDNKSTKSGKSVRSTRSNSKNRKKATDLDKAKNNGNKKATVKEVIPKKARSNAKKLTDREDDEVDSRVGDFDQEEVEEDVLSMGSDASKLARIEQEISELEPSMAEKYNEFKVKQGYQVRLEDAELPENLHEDEVYDEVLKLHKEQLAATDDRQKKVLRVNELEKLRDEIVAKRENSKLIEAQRNILRQKAMYLRRKQAIENRKQQKELSKLIELQQQEWEELGMSDEESPQTEEIPAKTVHKSVKAKSQITKDWVIAHSHSTGGGRDAPEQTIHRGTREIDMDALQLKAQRLVEGKMKHRKAMEQNKTTDHELRTNFTPRSTQGGGDSEFPKKGVQHLKKLELIPDTAGMDHRRTNDDENQGNNPLQYRNKFDYGMALYDEIETEHAKDTCCQINKTKIKSGRHAKTGINLVRQEVWPHNAVSRKYVRKPTFETMDFETFVAGKVKLYTPCFLKMPN